MHHCLSATNFDVRAWFILILSLVSLACVVGLPVSSSEATSNEQRSGTHWTAEVSFYQYQKEFSHTDDTLKEVKSMHKQVEDEIKNSKFLLVDGDTVDVSFDVGFGEETPPMFFGNVAGFWIKWRNGQRENRSEGTLKYVGCSTFTWNPPYEVELDSNYKPIEKDPKTGKTKLRVMIPPHRS
ncbi:hypothetical protein F5050DRAFT_1775699 [Lentinula boryana]|uniref:Uncharacterized protein n=1 Tax=Lentinula boryana TaxID=40481 RepID=A0ABQ8Q774_9AGAR|nr:hypothetical protein F5050DRAFT_1775699 [Lentinula boryana]